MAQEKFVMPSVVTTLGGVRFHNTGGLEPLRKQAHTPRRLLTLALLIERSVRTEDSWVELGTRKSPEEVFGEPVSQDTLRSWCSAFNTAGLPPLTLERKRGTGKVRLEAPEHRSPRFDLHPIVDALKCSRGQPSVTQWHLRHHFGEIETAPQRMWLRLPFVESQDADMVSAPPDVNPASPHENDPLESADVDLRERAYKDTNFKTWLEAVRQELLEHLTAARTAHYRQDTALTLLLGLIVFFEDDPFVLLNTLFDRLEGDTLFSAWHMVLEEALGAALHDATEEAGRSTRFVCRFLPHPDSLPQGTHRTLQNSHLHTYQRWLEGLRDPKCPDVPHFRSRLRTLLALPDPLRYSEKSPNRQRITHLTLEEHHSFRPTDRSGWVCNVRQHEHAFRQVRSTGQVVHLATHMKRFEGINKSEFDEMHLYLAGTPNSLTLAARWEVTTDPSKHARVFMLPEPLPANTRFATLSEKHSERTAVTLEAKMRLPTPYSSQRDLLSSVLERKVNRSPAIERLVLRVQLPAWFPLRLPEGADLHYGAVAPGVSSTPENPYPDPGDDARSVLEGALFSAMHTPDGWHLELHLNPPVGHDRLPVAVYFILWATPSEAELQHAWETRPVRGREGVLER